MVPLSVFYSGSALSELFTPEEFWANVSLIECPRCGDTLGGNIWPYEFRFDADDEIEERIERLQQIARATPFLVLSDDFGREVYDEVLRVASTIGPTQLPTLFRGRSASNLQLAAPRDLEPPPPAITREGRYNHAGRPVCYLASDAHTVGLELRRTQDEPIWIAPVNLTGPVRILDLCSADLASDVLLAAVTSTLLSQPSGADGWNRPEYAFTRFVGDCAVAACLDGIRYPSTRAATGDNIVIFSGDVERSGLLQIGQPART